MKSLLAIVGVIIVIASVVFGVYVGVWWAFIGGIVEIIDQVKAPVTDSYEVAVAIAKVMFAGVLGTAAGIVGCVIGISFIAGGSK